MEGSREEISLVTSTEEFFHSFVSLVRRIMFCIIIIIIIYSLTENDGGGMDIGQTDGQTDSCNMFIKYTKKFTTRNCKRKIFNRLLRMSLHILNYDSRIVFSNMLSSTSNIKIIKFTSTIIVPL